MTDPNGRTTNGSVYPFRIWTSLEPGFEDTWTTATGTLPSSPSSVDGLLFEPPVPLHGLPVHCHYQLGRRATCLHRSLSPERRPTWVDRMLFISLTQPGDQTPSSPAPQWQAQHPPAGKGACFAAFGTQAAMPQIIASPVSARRLPKTRFHDFTEYMSLQPSLWPTACLLKQFQGLWVSASLLFTWQIDRTREAPELDQRLPKTDIKYKDPGTTVSKLHGLHNPTSCHLRPVPSKTIPAP